MQLIHSEILQKYTEINFAFSTKVGLNRKAPFYFNLSLSVGDEEKNVKENRKAFFAELGLSEENVAIQKQIHSDIVRYVSKGGIVGESDAMITDKKNLGLAVGIADCTPIFIYDPENKFIAAVHSGWRGTEKRILEKTILILKNEFNSKPQKLVACIGPSISQRNYEVGKEVADLFDDKYKIKKDGKYLLDVASANYDMLVNLGLKGSNIEKSNLCTYEEKNLLHSFRRDGKKSGRSMGIIVMRD
jgi:purine-nucleoside/S-methyl-5'-thioadenosine phosphorylase / adenosine deaminase